MNNMAIKLFLFIFLSFNIAQSQQSDKKKITDIFNKTGQKYNTTDTYQTSMKYNLYPTYASKLSSEFYNGIAIKKGNEFYSKIGETEFVNLNKYHIKIDNESKLIQYSVSESKKIENNELNVADYLNKFKTFELSNNNEDWICTMTTPAFSFIPYTKVVVYINKKDYTISKQILYLITMHSYKTKDGIVKEDYPRIEILFNEFKTKEIQYGNIFSLQNYLSISKNSITPSNKYKEYKIVN